MELIPLSDFIEYQNEFITINDSQEYTRVTTKLHRKGVVLRDVAKGLEIKTKRQQICGANQLLVAEIDAKVGGYGIVPKELEGAIVSSHYFLFNINANEFLPEYLAYVLKTDAFFSQIKAQGSTNYAAIRPKDILKIKIPYCAIDLQRNLVEKLNAIAAKNRGLNENILWEKESISKLRQAILQEAVSGKLVPQDPKDEPASELLKKIKAEKEKLIRERRIKKEQYLPSISEEEIPYELPKGWSWVRLGDYYYLQTGATPSTKVAEYWGGNIKWLKSGDVNLEQIYNCKGRITEEGLSHSNCKILLTDSVLIALNGQGKTRGTVAMLRTEAACNQSLVSMRSYDKTLLIPEYLYYFLKANYMKIRKITGHKQRHGLNMKIIGNMHVAIPPYEEQFSIVQKVERLMKLCDELKEKVKENQNNSELLMGAVLKEAFAS